MFTRIRECLISFVAHTELATDVLHMEMETCQQPEMAVQCSTYELLFQKTLCVFTQVGSNHHNNVPTITESYLLCLF